MVTHKKSSTASAILDCAVSIIEEQGESGVRISDITECTGVSISSIYHFFDDREGLIAAAQAQRYVRSLELQMEAHRAVFSGITSADELRTLALGLSSLANNPERAKYRLERMNVIGSTLGRPVLAQKVAEIQDRFVIEFGEMIAAAQAKGWIRPDVDPLALAAFMVGTILGRTLIEIGPSSVDPEEWTKVFLVAMTAVLEVPGGSPRRDRVPE